LRAPAARPRAEYAVWTAAAVWLGNRGAGANPKLGALAAALVARALARDERQRQAPLPADAARFAIRLLCDVGAFAETAAALPLVADPSEAAHLRADVAYRAGDGATAVALYREMLAEGDSNDWGHWLRYIELAGADDAAALVEALCARTREAAYPPRGQFIAGLELRRRRGDWPGLRDSAERYFQRFGAKAVCARDLRPYVLALERAAAGDGAALVCGLDDASCGGGGARHLHASWLRLWLGCLEETPAELHARYEAMLVERVESTDRQPGDDYILLAAHRLLPRPSDGSDRYADQGRVLEVITLLEAALVRSPFNFQFKLLAVRLYQEAGAVRRAFEIWRTLEVKHVQTATLSHLVVRPMVDHGWHAEFADYAVAFDRLWAECERDIPESVSRAFDVGSVNAAVEFLEFRDRLERSGSLVRALLCGALVQLASASGGSEALGVERAWDILGDEARILPSSMDEPHRLLANEDSRCMEFWDVDGKGDEGLRDMDAPGADEGEPMSRNDQAVLLVELLVARCVARLGARGEHSAEDLDLLHAAYARVSAPPPHATYMYTMVRTVCQLFTALRSGQVDEVDVDAASAGAKYVCDEAATISALAPRPRALGRAGRLVYEALLPTSIALASLGKASIGGRPAAKRVARSVVQTYAAVALEACHRLEPLAVVAVDTDGGDGGGAVDFLPDVLRASVRNDVASDHLESTARLRAAIQAVHVKLKMMAL
jgi:N-acetyltransferase B complex (NatB) non catalytic subunit